MNDDNDAVIMMVRMMMMMYDEARMTAMMGIMSQTTAQYGNI